MPDQPAATGGGFKNASGKISVKKILGALGILIVYTIGVVVAIKSPDEAVDVMKVCGVTAGALLGIKTVGGVAGAIANRPGLTP